VLDEELSKQSLSPEDEHDETLRNNLTHYSCLTLPHFLALISRPTPTAIAPNVSLVVINGASALINSALPRSHGSMSNSKKTQGKCLVSFP
jgi:hypothetical protein